MKKVLIDSSDIIDAKYKIVPPITGIYFLILNTDIVYVGQSTDVEFRVHSHRRRGEKVFDSFYCVSCDPEKLDILEAEYIVQFNPRYNTSPPSFKSPWRSLGALKNTLNIGLVQLKRYIKEKNIPDTNGWYNIDDFSEMIL
jgi:excinuclease UvrABC nuclease subunit